MFDLITLYLVPYVCLSPIVLLLQFNLPCVILVFNPNIILVFLRIRSIKLLTIFVLIIKDIWYDEGTIQARGNAIKITIVGDKTTY